MCQTWQFFAPDIMEHSNQSICIYVEEHKSRVWLQFTTGLVWFRPRKKVSVYISSNFRSIKESTAHVEQFNLATGEHLLIWFVCLFVRFDFVCLFCFVFSFVLFVCVRGVWGVCVGWVGCVWGVCVGECVCAWKTSIPLPGLYATIWCIQSALYLYLTCIKEPDLKGTLVWILWCVQRDSSLHLIKVDQSAELNGRKPSSYITQEHKPWISFRFITGLL